MDRTVQGGAAPVDHTKLPGFRGKSQSGSGLERQGPPPRIVTNCNKLAGSVRRHRLSVWRALGHAPADLAPAAIAAAFTRVTGRPPARDARGMRRYSAAELAAALAELGQSGPPPAQPLDAIWAEALAGAAWPTVRTLLLQRCRLVVLEQAPYPTVWAEALATVLVDPGFLTLVQARAGLVAELLSRTVGCPVALQLAGVV